MKTKPIPILKVQDEDIQRSMFENKKSFEYFMRGVAAAKQINTLLEEGYLLFENGEPMSKSEPFYVWFGDGDNRPHLGTIAGNVRVAWLGSTYGNDNTVFVYAEEMNPFKKITYVSPKDIKKLKVEK